MLFQKKAVAVKNGHSNEPQAAPPERIRNAILQQAVREQADAVLVEPMGDRMRIQYRIAGHWHETMTIPQILQVPLTTSFRTAACLPPAGTPRQMPSIEFEDTDQPVTHAARFEIGLILFHHEGADYDAYASFLPTRWGERVAVRLSPKSDAPTPLTPWELLQL